MKVPVIALALAGAGLAAGAPAARAQGPVASNPQEPLALPAPAYGGAPSETHYTVAPRLLNREFIGHKLAQQYPTALRNEGRGGTTNIAILIDERGRVLTARIRRSSGAFGLDAAALRVVSAMRFSPGLRDQQPVRVWIAMPVIFAVGAAAPHLETPADNPSRRSQRMHFESPPTIGAAGASLLNEGHLLEQLRALYDARFPDGSAHGKARLKLRLDASGNATGATVSRSAGNPALDSLALAATRIMVFVPAVDERGLFVPAETSMTLAFPPKPE